MAGHGAWGDPRDDEHRDRGRDDRADDGLPAHVEYLQVGEGDEDGRRGLRQLAGEGQHIRVDERVAEDLQDLPRTAAPVLHGVRDLGPGDGREG